MRKTIYRVLTNQNNINQEFLISHDCLPAFVQQNKDCINFQVMQGGSLVINVENSTITHCNGLLSDTELDNSLIGLGDLLKLYKVTQEEISLETYWIYSTSEEQARRDFLEWSVFVPLEVSLVA
ncbi:hypothetical protein FAY30_26255 (plasmid) [Bacillus sp. S3]|uniref:hypothetical protein n=1 Tax=Bacillus sp. S3 TaxID=486398 RepID=UPI001187996D|nr:hypothetical protein [Bacillus sp. S3]QCJ45450.1 hypothetical protein FAY30_26255 [Bacillus sp. S3]